MINIEITKTDYIICLSILALNLFLAFMFGVYVLKTLGIGISLIK